ncbi:MAG TPA: MFS transporter [Methanomassiliicoccales archaeon]|nr:MFS transporter [Methanomassiliicoccales archaeon]
MPREEFVPKEEVRYRRIALLIVMMGVMMAAIDTTAVVLALPVMITDLHTDIISIVWVLLAYLLVITILGTQVGRLGDMFGRVRMYNVGFAIFTIGSFLCGFSSSGGEIIIWRILQGVGGAFISSNSGAIIADVFSEKERGKAFGITGVGWSVGAVLGILIGGAFVTFLNWRYIFFINLPIGVIATVGGYILLKERSPRIKEKMDLVGIGLLGGGLTMILVSLTGMAGEGFTTPLGILLLIGVVIVVLFVLWERYYKAPFLDLKILRNRVLSASMFAAFFQSLASYAVIFLVVMYLQGPRGMDPFSASVLLIPGFVLGGLIAPFSGRLSDRHGARIIASVGLLLQVCGILVYFSLDLSSSLYLVVLGSVLNGAGSSTFFPANTSAVMAAAPKRAYGVTAGLLRTLANLGMVCSFAVALFFASVSLPRDIAFQIFLGTGGLSPVLSADFVQAMHSALLASILLLAVAFVLSVLRGKEERAKR